MEGCTLACRFLALLFRFGAALFSLVFFVVGIGAGGEAAWANSIVAKVNEQIITSYDVEQRLKLIKIITGREPTEASRDQTIQELIDEIIIVDEAHKKNLSVPKGHVQRTLQTIADGTGNSLEDFVRLLWESEGLDIATLEARISSQVLWQMLARNAFQQSGNLQEQDVNRALEKLGDKRISRQYEYALQDVTLLLNDGESETKVKQRWAEAQRLSAKIRSCDELLNVTKGLRDVIIEQKVQRKSNDLNEKTNEVLESTAEGRATMPALNEKGIGFLVVCEKREVFDDGLARMEVQNKIANDEFSVFLQSYLRTLRNRAIVTTY